MQHLSVPETIAKSNLLCKSFITSFKDYDIVYFASVNTPSTSKTKALMTVHIFAYSHKLPLKSRRVSVRWIASLLLRQSFVVFSRA